MYKTNPALLDSSATLVPTKTVDKENDADEAGPKPLAEAATKLQFDDPDQLFAALLFKMKEYHPASDFSLVEDAYRLAKDAHKGQKRKSGEPYIVHPVAVATILADLEMDRETIAAGILHDILEDTDYTYNDLVEMFSEEVAKLVDGVTKLKMYAAQRRDENNREEEQAENFRKMFLAMANDIRVIIIKIADRLHNLRTLSHMPPHKQQRIAQESLDIYAPLAGRLGIATLRRDMEDLSFRFSNNEAYNELKDKISMKRSERMKFVEDIVGNIKRALAEHGLNARVEGRPKHFFSVYKKMKQQRKDIDQIYDLFAVRIILNTDDKNQCYTAMGAVHSVFTPIPDRFKDYVAMPKGNGYQSLHNTLVGPGGEFFEVQIRTAEMHRVAEYGIAAHWKYKEKVEGKDGSEVKLAWLREILELHTDNPDNQEFLEALKGDLDVYTEYVHCFTPNGEVKILVKGSTCIDFAYAIHSAVGNRMVGARVNHKIETKEYVISNGDQIEIITRKDAKGPTPDWLKIVKTSQAKNKIRQWLKKGDKEENAVKGKNMLEAAAKKKGITLTKLLTPDAEKMILNRHSFRDIDTLFASVGRGSISENTIINRLCAEYLIKNPLEQPDAQAIIDDINKAAARKEKVHVGDVILRGESDLDVRFSKCCGPVPGDDIIGFVTRTRGATIHRRDCINIINLPPAEAERLVEAQWNVDKETKNNFQVDLNIVCDNMGLVSKVTEVLGKMSVDIKGLSCRPVGDDAVFTAAIIVKNRDELEHVANKLSSLRGVHEVNRITTS
ncbi:MAG: bifunctional (p)ppGpp synthetase/guanosine-3',5'-bis(diphosphate) 3'-pyrophosphohydrolase [Clostridiales bacterium]|nr:bifunctional (p)ppGpp synthetase/guanosine-3',5'-bis(diphosphate) 3'-pyrophosphohydrolase [Clostridiales bacterium]